MKAENQKIVGASSAVQKLIAQFDAMQPAAQRQTTQAIQELYPSITAAKGRGTSLKEILKALQDSGIQISLGGLGLQLKAEETRRKEHGDKLHCKHCGASLHTVVEENGFASLLKKDQGGTANGSA